MRDDEAESIACPRNPRTGVQHPKIQNEEKEREKKNIMNVIDTKDCMSKAKKKNGSWPNE